MSKPTMTLSEVIKKLTHIAQCDKEYDPGEIAVACSQMADSIDANLAGRDSGAPSIQIIRGAVARGWCSPENAHKEMDSILAEAISQEVQVLLAKSSKAQEELVCPYVVWGKEGTNYCRLGGVPADTEKDAEIAALRGDRDCWEEQAMDRAKDWDEMRIRAETAETRLHILLGAL